MITGNFDYVMSKSTPLMLPFGGEEESNASAESNQLCASTLARAFNASEERLLQTGVSNQKRPAQTNQEASVSNKQMKVDHPSSGSELPGWGPNGRAVNVPDSGLFVGSLLQEQINSGLRNAPNGITNAQMPNNGNSLRGNDLTLHQNGLSVIREQMHRNEAINALLLSNFYSPHVQHQGNYADLSFLDAVNNRQQANFALQHQVQSQIPSMLSLNQINHGFFGSNGTYNTLGANSAYSANIGGQGQGILANDHLQSFLRQLQSTDNFQQSSQNLSTMMVEQNTQTLNEPSSERPIVQQNVAQRQCILSNGPPNLDLALCVEGKIQPYSGRPIFCLGISEDPNWLSEFHCFIRSELVEVFRASHDDVTCRNNSISYQQVGLRCRFCAHLPPSSRSGRSSAFPSSLRQIYQSFTMMLRDHFSNCEVIPASAQSNFNHLKDKPAQGATDSKRYWIYSAKKLGMFDTDDGIKMTKETRYEGNNMESFGTVVGQNWEDDALRNDSLVRSTDRASVADFLILLMIQVQPIRLTETECIGNRRSLQVGLPGFGCRYCCDQKRLGLCRMFPARRRTLPNKVNDLYDHLRRCTLCPQTVKDSLEQSKSQMTESFTSDHGGNREFYDRVWSRLGHSSVTTSTK